MHNFYIARMVLNLNLRILKEIISIARDAPSYLCVCILWIHSHNEDAVVMNPRSVLYLDAKYLNFGCELGEFVISVW